MVPELKRASRAIGGRRCDPAGACNRSQGRQPHDTETETDQRYGRNGAEPVEDHNHVMEKWQQQVMLEGKWIELATFPNWQVDRVVGTCNYIVKYIESSAEEA